MALSKPRLRLWIQLGLAWPRRYLDNTERALRRDSDKRTESEAESKAEAVVLKRAYGSFIFLDKKYYFILAFLANYHLQYVLPVQMYRTVNVLSNDSEQCKQELPQIVPS